MKKPKRSKWVKWKVGGGIVFSLALLMQTAKADPVFEKAHADALRAADQGEETEETAATDPVIDEWRKEDAAKAATEATTQKTVRGESATLPPSSIKEHTANPASDDMTALPAQSPKTASAQHATKVQQPSKTQHDSIPKKTTVKPKTAPSAKTASATNKSATPAPMSAATEKPAVAATTAPAPTTPPADYTPTAPAPIVTDSTPSLPAAAIPEETAPDSSTDTPTEVQEQPAKKSHTKSHHS